MDDFPISPAPSRRRPPRRRSARPRQARSSSDPSSTVEQRWAQLADRSRRQHSIPIRTAETTEATIVAIRDAHPAWGARKIAHCLKRDGVRAPAVSTVHAVFRRHGRILPPRGAGSTDQRFEKQAANLLWQMDFKDWIRLASGQRCHPLTVIERSVKCPHGLALFKAMLLAMWCDLST